MHQALTTDGDQSIEDRAEALARAVEQVEGFGRPREEADEDGNVPVVLSGQLPERGDLASVLRAMLGREILTPSPPVEYPEGFLVVEYANAIGLALLDQARPTGFKRVPVRDAVPLSLLFSEASAGAAANSAGLGFSRADSVCRCGLQPDIKSR